MYYINDGVYGSFNCVLYDHYVPEPHLTGKVGFFAVFCGRFWPMTTIFRMNRKRNSPRPFGVQHAMVSIASKKPFLCQNYNLVNGWSGRTWVPIQSQPLFNSMVYPLASQFISCRNHSGKSKWTVVEWIVRIEEETVDVRIWLRSDWRWWCLFRYAVSTRISHMWGQSFT